MLYLLEKNCLLHKTKDNRIFLNWASEASPTLGCSIEILLDIYISICMSVVGLSTIVYGKPIQKMVCQYAWAELCGPNTRMLQVIFVILKQSAAWKS